MKKQILATAVAGALALGMAGTANATIDIQAQPEFIEFSVADDTLDVGIDGTVTMSVDVTKTGTGRDNYAFEVWLDGCGAAVASPDAFDIDFAGGDLVTIQFTVSGFDTVGTCTVGFASINSGVPFNEEGVATITVTADDVTTTAPGDDDTTTTAGGGSGGIVSAGSNTQVVGMFALLVTVLGGLVVAATRRRSMV